ncbi:MAG: ornithine cyclodeaminase family protein [Candidatus Aminicenantaceae bacterium]
MTPGKVLYLSQDDVATIDLPMTEIVAALEGMFREKGEGRTEMPPKPGIHPRPDAFIHAMPAYIPALESAGMKWVAGNPANPAKGIPYIMGLLVLNDPETGQPIAIMDCIWITAKRTGAATAVAAKYLARADSTTAGILACGVQGRSNLEALCSVFPVEHVRAYDLHPEKAEEYAREMRKTLGVAIETVGTPREAVEGRDIVVTSGPILRRPEPTIPPGWLAEGGFACAVDYDSYWQGGALRQTDKLVTDDLAQLEDHRRLGYFQDTPVPYADLGQIVAGKKPGRESEQERIISLNLGLALDDMATAIRIYRRALELGIGTELPL